MISHSLADVKCSFSEYNQLLNTDTTAYPFGSIETLHMLELLYWELECLNS